MKSHSRENQGQTEIPPFFLSFIYLFEREGEHEQGVELEAEGEADSLLSREPDVGLDLRTRDHDLSQRQMLN